ncbi:hypothetical protein J8Z24_10310 [Pseudoalteromonas sp. SCSIO 43201]|uniref:hypothetical protein n=1 Tax=Pseudoalteromonas sp. SCSIO 43201 TaxID=2822842 RepID=UPI002074E243|nr:hypothetical protein [Pseudoalteromonas sp. SCSIO 43201]USD27375.1 hypothetical protein J8Z24_10310 [Pseudoalteromonas sp. SCSIO 43201]
MTSVYLRQLIGALVAIFPLFSVASVDDNNQQVIERIEVIGEKPQYVLKLEMESAKKDFYDLYNKFASDDSFKTKCDKKPRHGSKIKSFKCETRFTKESFHSLTKQHIQLNIQDLKNPAYSLKYLSMPDASDVRSVTNTKRKAQKADILTQINENPELRAAFERFAKKYDAYENR